MSSRAMKIALQYHTPFEARLDIAGTKLRQALREGIDCRSFMLLAHELLGDVSFSMQYVHHPDSSTGVYHRIYFLPNIQGEGFDTEVPTAWIAWQI